MKNMAPEAAGHRMESLIGNLLRAGVILAASIVLAGGVLFLARHGTAPIDYAVFRPVSQNLSGIGAIVSGAFSLNDSALIQLGLLVLIATPIARVIFSLFMFARQRDVLYVIVTAIVAAILLHSLFF